MSIDYRVISIGTLSSHPLWNEPRAARTGHATTTLITSGDACILVDPSLPAQALIARLSERSPVRPEAITHVFMTSFEPERRRGLRAFESATWLLHEPEREAALESLETELGRAADAGDEELVTLLRAEQAIVQRTVVAPDRLAPGVDLFPMPGLSAGSCGLLLARPAETVLICGDTVATTEHLEQGKVLPGCAGVEQAQESFKEAVEIADVLVPGRDNVILNPLRRL